MQGAGDLYSLTTCPFSHILLRLESVLPESGMLHKSHPPGQVTTELWVKLYVET